MEIKAVIFKSIAFVVFLALFPNCQRRPKITDLHIEGERLPVQEFFDSTRFTLTENNRKIWTLRTTHIIKYRKNGYTDVNPVHVDYFATTGNSVLTADSGRISSGTDTLIAMGRVDIKTIDGKHVSTTLIAWDKKSGKVTSDRHVRMVTVSGDIYSGNGFVANTDLSEWRILKNVHAEICDVGKKLKE